MKKKRVRYSKVKQAVEFIKDVGRGYARVMDPESLRRACFVVSNYLEILEMESSETAKRSATIETENMIRTDAAKRTAAQITLFDTEGIEHGHEPPT